jgi:hypothetical protein
MAIRIESTVRNGNVFVRCGDIVKSLYVDLADTEDPEIKKYIKGNIELWEEYERDILIQASKR